MIIVLLFVFLIVLGYLWPRYLLFLITVPLVGTGLGGLAWSISAMLCSGLVTLPTLGGFLLGGNLVALCGGIMLDH